MTKICFVSSSGGHLKEIIALKELSNYYSAFLVSEKSDFTNVDFGCKQYFVSKIDRKERFFIFHFFTLFFKALNILRTEKPDIVLTTGALASFPFCLLGKFLSMKIIYIESYARINKPSLTGKLVYRFADLFIVQWKS